MAVHLPADEATCKHAERLRGVVNAHCRAFQVARRDFGNQRGQACFQNVEADEIDSKACSDQPNGIQAAQKRKLGQAHQCDAAQEHSFQPAARFADDDGGHHQHQPDNGGGQIHEPMGGFVQPQVFQCKRQRGENRHQAGLQGENAEVQPQQQAVFQDFADVSRLYLCVFMQARTDGIGCVEQHQRDTGQTEHAHQHKQPAHADKPAEHGRQHKAGGKRQADA